VLWCSGSAYFASGALPLAGGQLITFDCFLCRGGLESMVTESLEGPNTTKALQSRSSLGTQQSELCPLMPSGMYWGPVDAFRGPMMPSRLMPGPLCLDHVVVTGMGHVEVVGRWHVVVIGAPCRGYEVVACCGYQQWLSCRPRVHVHRGS